MWADYETAIDLLGFEFLVDELEVLLTEERLLPVTIGVDGDWGSGKSSLMEMTRQRLETGENAGRFICVAFSPWRFEDFEYGKVALMAAVVDAIVDYTEEHKSRLKTAAEKANRLRGALHRWGILRHTATVGTLAAGGSPEEAQAAGAGADALGEIGPAPAEGAQRSFETVAHFHEQFAELIESLGEELQAVVVFLDDMDRCSTETIVETFEAMRLFLHAPKTAYVVGAHYDIVEAALDGRYPARREGDEALGRNYLEKMLQNTIAVPPLSEPEAQTFINLLFAELYTTPDQYMLLREEAAKRRARNQLSVAMTDGIARDVIGELGDELAAALEVAVQVATPLARGLRGNPRQIKRFLNRLRVRLRTSDKRGMGLEADKLAKLMVLEELHPQHFEQLFLWQLETETGTSPELVAAERLARGDRPKNPPRAASDWAVQPGVRDWLLLEPTLGSVNLTSYFTFSRDRLTTTISAARLSTELLALLTDLQSSTRPKRAKAITTAAKLEPAELAELLPAIIDGAKRDLTKSPADGLFELAAMRTEVATALFDMLDAIPVSRLTGNVVLKLNSQFKGNARLAPLLEAWESKAPKSDVKRQARRALGRE